MSNQLEHYRRLHDALSDMIEDGRLTEASIPDDYAALVEILATVPVQADKQTESLRKALSLMMEVQSLRRHPLGAPNEGLAYKAANAMLLARNAMGSEGDADLSAALTDDASLRAELIAMGWAPPNETAYIVLSEDGDRIRYWSRDRKQAEELARKLDRPLVPGSIINKEDCESGQSPEPRP